MIRRVNDTRYVRVLEEDPDLGAGLAPEEFERARKVAVAVVDEVAPGPWSTTLPVTEPGTLGLLVIGGILGLEITAAERTNLELLGAGDVIRPWSGIGPEASVPRTAGWSVLAPARIALLDARFARAALAWPEITAALMERLVLRNRRQNFLLAVHALPRLEERLQLVLWHLADRWGRVTSAGVVVEVPLTHQALSQVVGASRPSVSTALGHLRAQGRIEPSTGGWLLHGESPALLKPLREQVALPPGRV
jgi:CRP/FNR family cyclic AMP-dependent transcriptional regulator